MTSTKELDHLFGIWVTAVHKVGGIPKGAKLTLTHGSKTYGIAFRQHLTGDGTFRSKYNSAHYRPLIGSDFLGLTKTEAANTIRTMLNVLWDMKQINREKEKKQ